MLAPSRGSSGPVTSPAGGAGPDHGPAIPGQSTSSPEDGAVAPDQSAAKAEGAVGYRASHNALLVDVSAPADLTEGQLGHEIDLVPLLGASGCVLLPTSRSFTNDPPGLALAVELALSHQCELIVLCSLDAKVSEFPEVFREKLAHLLTLVDLAGVHPDWLPPLDSRSNGINRFRRYNDVGSKRNIGLALAVAKGWERVLFLDDDISSSDDHATLNSVHLSHALHTMQENASLRAVGWSAHDYDDNSVVGHARPFVDLPQDVFIGGGALLVRSDPALPFFPDIYNEDWLFLIALMAGAPDHQLALGWGGRVHQRSYPPFRSRRARSEEVGEIIGEGLMNLFEDHGPRYVEVMTTDYWRRALHSRRQLLQLIKKAAERQADRRFRALGPRGRQSLVAAMNAAQAVHRELSAVELAEFVRVWRDDVAVWRRHLALLAADSRPRLGTLPTGPVLRSSPLGLVAAAGESQPAAAKLGGRIRRCSYGTRTLVRRLRGKVVERPVTTSWRPLVGHRKA